jgi:hypothetical protein
LAQQPPLSGLPLSHCSAFSLQRQVYLGVLMSHTYPWQQPPLSGFAFVAQ